MKILKICTLTTLMIGVVFMWTSCQKELSSPSNSTVSNENRKSGSIADDPVALGKVPVIMSSEFISNGLQASPSSGLYARGGRDRTPPAVSITSPASGSSVSGTINVTVSASDNVGVASVKLYIDGSTTAVSTSTGSPFTNSWNTGTVANGSHTLKVIASDAAGNTASSSVNINVNNVVPVGDITPPTVTITAPANNSSFNPNITVSVTVNATDNMGVTSVKLYVDGGSTPVSTSTVSPFTNTWNTGTVTSGGHTLTVKAFDAAGNQGSSSVSVTVNTTVINPPVLPSSVTLQMPPVIYQGSEGSCTAIALNYSRSFEQFNRTGATSYSESTNIFSPEFLFNLTKSGSYCDGSALLTSLNLLVNTGICPWASMPYTGYDCSLLPNSSQYAAAANYKIASYSKVFVTDLTAIKTLLAARRTLTSQVTIDNNFRNATPGYIWNSFGTNPGFHALTLCGYDDAKRAFKAINGWGTTFGDAGYIWIDYDFFKTVSSDLFVMNF